ncbi:flagellar hook-basal body complex protein FliE [Sporomusaceae bacterium BoRhaA]|uniref:flagellar hook-basal body complex protein FliE n=1 Tax=Pelorhabdus rhamnosifermentans TaxID=2772457 RepID=UPI001C06297F|nr:flagellar hook-basal body complex protein FliE [Pelorhabdus rhamnosifermentans]
MSVDVISSAAVKPVAAQSMKAPSSSKSETGVTFGQLLSNALGDVNKLQLDANQASVNLATGKVQDISEAVIATEKASMALQLTMQVRNKVIDAYQEIMRMQV